MGTRTTSVMVECIRAASARKTSLVVCEPLASTSTARMVRSRGRQCPGPVEVGQQSQQAVPVVRFGRTGLEDHAVAPRVRLDLPNLVLPCGRVQKRNLVVGNEIEDERVLGAPHSWS